MDTYDGLGRVSAKLQYGDPGGSNQDRYEVRCAGAYIRSEQPVPAGRDGLLDGDVIRCAATGDGSDDVGRRGDGQDNLHRQSDHGNGSGGEEADEYCMMRWGDVTPFAIH